VNAIVRPIAVVLSLPALLVTVGLFLLVINAAMLGLTSWLLGPTRIGFHVDGFAAAVWGGLVFAIAGFFARKLITDD
jgi:putative membrane protein